VRAWRVGLGQQEVTLLAANSTWTAKEYEISQDFKDIAKNYYDAEARELTDVASVNKWCAEHTNNLIKQVLSTLDPPIKMLLVNAIYFKGAFQFTFDQDQTSLAHFHTRKDVLEIEFMKQKRNNFMYKQSNTYQAVLLEYGQKFASVVVLPTNNDVLDEMVKNLPGTWTNLFFEEYVKSKGFLTFPRFQIEYGSSMAANLKLLGINTAFTKHANFSHLSNPGDLYIGDVIHRAILKVNEEGAEAAAVTVVATRCRKKKTCCRRKI